VTVTPSRKPRQQRIDPAKVRAKTNAKAKAPAKTRRGSKAPDRGPRRASAADWIGGARLRTLSVAVAPVALGTACALLVDYGHLHWLRALACLAVALCLQIGVNYANDYSDGVRGTDRYRVGPSRLTGSGAAKPRTVLTVALVFFGIAAAVGAVAVVWTGHWWMLAVGAASIAAAYFYTGGKRPYGYRALGEVAVFVFFGLAATAGTMYLQVGTVNLEGWLAGTAAGLIACAVLMVNNLRDRHQDEQAGKRTLSVVVGDRVSRILYAVFLLLPYAILGLFALLYRQTPYVFFTLLVAAPAVIITATAKTSAELVLALKLTSLTALLYGLGLAVTLVLV